MNAEQKQKIWCAVVQLAEEHDCHLTDPRLPQVLTAEIAEIQRRWRLEEVARAVAVERGIATDTPQLVAEVLKEIRVIINAVVEEHKPPESPGPTCSQCGVPLLDRTAQIVGACKQCYERGPTERRAS